MGKSLLLLLSLAYLCNALNIPLSSRLTPLLSLTTSANLSSLGAPIDPDNFAFLDFGFDVKPSPHTYDPTQLALTLWVTQLIFWRRPDNVPISEAQLFHTSQYPSLFVLVAPAPPVPPRAGFSTAVATASLDRLLWRLLAGPFIPAVYTLTVTTKAPLSIPIGSVQNTFSPEPVSDTRASNGSLIIQSPSANKTLLTIPPGAITIKHFPHGQTPGFPPVTPKQWLKMYTDMSRIAFEQVASDMIPIAWTSRPQVVFSDRINTDNYTLYSIVAWTSTPSGEGSPLWEELMVGLALVMQEVVHEQRFEPFDAEIYNNGELNFRVGLFYKRILFTTA